MDIKNMKNIVILRDLPSNVVEEAFIILKDNVKVQKEHIINKRINENSKINRENKNNQNVKKALNKRNQKNDEYIIKEAEMIVNDYVSKLEENSIKGTTEKMKLEEKCKRLKYSNIFFILFSIFSIISILIR